MTEPASTEPASTEPDLRAALATFAIGGQPVRVRSVDRAWSNRVFRVETTTGSFAVKQLLNPWRASNWRVWLEEAAAFEIRAWQAGIAMPRPRLTPDGHVLADVPDRTGAATVTVRVHDWVEGHPCPDGPVPTDIAASIGADLARTHNLKHHPTRADVFPTPSRDNLDGWDDLVRKLKERGSDLAPQAEAAKPAIRQIGALIKNASTDFTGEPMSHGDVDQKNLIMTNGGPVLCDWDVAAPWSARHELARTALSLADWTSPESARATYAGYAATGGKSFDITPEDLAVDTLIGLDWLCLSIERAAGLVPADDQRRREAVGTAPTLLARLGDQLQQINQIEAWFAS